MEHWSTDQFEIDDGGRVPVSCNAIDAAGNLVGDGVPALPALLRHLDDKRWTKLVVGRALSGKHQAGAGLIFVEDYDARRHTSPIDTCGAGAACSAKGPVAAPYRVRVGDVCLVLIGQIVNRQLYVVRAESGGIVSVNSPIESPDLAKRVRDDWAGVDAETLKASLLADIHSDALGGDPVTGVAALRILQWGALKRLRYYFPDAYAALSGADLDKRLAFERAERDGAQD